MLSDIPSYPDIKKSLAYPLYFPFEMMAHTSELKVVTICQMSTLELVILMSSSKNESEIFKSSND